MAAGRKAFGLPAAVHMRLKSKMENVVFIAAMVLFFVFIIAKGTWDSRKADKKFKQKLYDSYGEFPDREYKAERFERIGSYFQKHVKEGSIDDITWNDLNMDEIFKRMNHTLSAAGEEYLYYTLRSPKMSEKELLRFEELTDYFQHNPDSRVRVQLMMRRLGGTGKFSLYDYLEYVGNLGKRTNLKHILLNLAFLPLIGCTFFYTSVGLAGLAGLMVYNITTYFKEKREIEPYITSFAYVMRLLDICDRLVKIPLPVCREEWDIITKHKAKLGKMKSGSFWVLSGAAMNPTGNPLDIIMDYLRMTFHVDLMQFNKMLTELNRHLDDVDILVGQVGYVETSIAVGAYRASMGNGWCRPEFTEQEELCLEGCYHPLISQPVKNSITAKKGVLLTGSNASGKSTFLKTVAINAILAQTIHTCLCDKYCGPFYHIYSSMSLRDDIESGDSYYIVEIKSLKRILDAATMSGHMVLCFVDEVLRGTNTVERIAASTQILKSLSGSNLLCFAATHDIELTELLKEFYCNYHFEEEIMEGDVYFNYQLLSGKATTRNAIKLLEIMGYDDKIIQKAQYQAENFTQTGIWKLT